MNTQATFTIDLSTAEGLDLLRRITNAVAGYSVGDVPMPVMGNVPSPEPSVEAPASAPRRGRGKNKADAAEAEKVDSVPEAPASEPQTIDRLPGDDEADQSMAEELAAGDAAAPAPTREDMLPAVRKLVQEHVDKHGIPATAEILRRFGAARLADVKDDDLGTLTTALELSMTQPVKTDAAASLI